MKLQDLTLEEISITILFIVGLIGGVTYLRNAIRDAIKKLLDDQFKGVNTKLDGINNSVRSLDIQTTKNFLVRYLADVEREDVIYEQERERFWEEYDHYTKDLGENSYIKEWVARLKTEGKLWRKTDV